MLPFFCKFNSIIIQNESFFDIFNLPSDLIHKQLEQLGGFRARGRIRERFDVIVDSYNNKFFDFFFSALPFFKIICFIVF